MKYSVGTILDCDGVRGRVVENVKLPGDICVLWEHMTEIVSYDEKFLDENTKVVKSNGKETSTKV